MDDGRKEMFLRELRKHGIVGEAVKRASLHLHNPSMGPWYKERDADPEFAKAWDEALDIARYTVEAELHRRGVEGYDRPVYQGGKEVGSIKEYSDALLLARIRKLDPAYRQRQTIEHGGAVAVTPVDFSQLSDQSRDLMRQILEIETAKQAKIGRVDTPRLSVTVETTTDDSKEATPEEEADDGRAES